jgi:hypothetical protein
MVNHTQEAVDKLIINPSGRLATTPNKNKVKDRLNRNLQSQTGSIFVEIKFLRYVIKILGE